MNIQSRTYNNGTILEYIYTIVPKSGDSYAQSVFIDIQSGQTIDPNSIALTMDIASENKFQGICCNVVFPDGCEGWTTESGATWITDDGLCWAT